MDKKYEYYACQEFEQDIEKIMGILQERGLEKAFKNIYGPPAGGLVLATYLHYRLGEIPIIFDEKEIAADTLIVDDIADTGNTLLKYKQRGNFIITLFRHCESIVVPDIWLREKKGKKGQEENYVVFPWEKKE